LRALLRKGLSETAGRWPSVRKAYAWVQRAAEVLKNPEAESGGAVQKRLEAVVEEMSSAAPTVGKLRGAIQHFVKVTKSYWAGLFHCYEVKEVPRTNNDLEHLFGSHRYHERRASGRKVGSPSVVLRGSVRIVAAAATRLGSVPSEQLAPADIQAWRTLRGELDQRRQARTLRRRFRRNPDAYLGLLEQKLLKSTLPT